MEAARHKLGQPIKQTANKLSSVKQKGANPKWQLKQQQSNKKDNEESEKKPCAHRCCSGHKVKSDRLNRLTTMKKTKRLSPCSSLAVPLWPLPPSQL